MTVFATACAAPGCPEITKERYCRRHRQTERRRRAAAEAAYGPAWQQLRRQVLTEEPFCRCGQRTTTVDHKVALSQGGTNERSNLQGMCKRCHDRKTATEDMPRGEGGRWG